MLVSLVVAQERKCSNTEWDGLNKNPVDTQTNSSKLTTVSEHFSAKTITFPSNLRITSKNFQSVALRKGTCAMPLEAFTITTLRNVDSNVWLLKNDTL